jgi:hypothetical protein
MKTEAAVSELATCGDLIKALAKLPPDAVPEALGEPLLKKHLKKLEPWTGRISRGRLVFAEDGKPDAFPVVSLRGDME